MFVKQRERERERLRSAREKKKKKNKKSLSKRIGRVPFDIFDVSREREWRRGNRRVKPATSFFPNGETQRKQKRRTTVRVTLCPARRLRRGSPVRVVVVVVVAIILQRREKIHHRRLLGFDGHFACREKNKSPRRMFYRSSREKASFRVALLENAREGFFLRRPRSAFFRLCLRERWLFSLERRLPRLIL